MPDLGLPGLDADPLRLLVQVSTRVSLPEAKHSTSAEFHAVGLVLTNLAGALTSAMAKAVAAETLLGRWLDRSRKERVRSDIHELNGRQFYRATRHDAALGMRVFVGGLNDSWV